MLMISNMSNVDLSEVQSVDGVNPVNISWVQHSDDPQTTIFQAVSPNILEWKGKCAIY